MGENDLVWKYCNLQKREAAFSTALEGSAEDNMRILGNDCLQCLDVEDTCYGLDCKFVLGKTNPFIVD